MYVVMYVFGLCLILRSTNWCYRVLYPGEDGNQRRVRWNIHIHIGALSHAVEECWFRDDKLLGKNELNGGAIHKPTGKN